MLTFKDRRIKVWAEYDIAKEKETERRRSKQRHLQVGLATNRPWTDLTSKDILQEE